MRSRAVTARYFISYLLGPVRGELYARAPACTITHRRRSLGLPRDETPRSMTRAAALGPLSILAPDCSASRPCWVRAAPAPPPLRITSRPARW